MIDAKHASYYAEQAKQPIPDKKPSTLKKASFFSVVAIFFACTFASMTSPSELNYSTTFTPNSVQTADPSTGKDVTTRKDPATKEPQQRGEGSPTLGKGVKDAPLNTPTRAPTKSDTDDSALSNNSYARISMFSPSNVRNGRTKNAETPSAPVTPRPAEEALPTETTSDPRLFHKATTPLESPPAPSPLGAFLFFSTAFLALSTAKKTLQSFGNSLLLKIGQAWDHYWEEKDREDRANIAEAKKYEHLVVEETENMKDYNVTIANSGQRINRTHLSIAG